MNREHYKMQVTEDGGFNPSGAMAQHFNRLFRPASAESRQQLLQLKEHWGLSVASMGALLGVGRSTARRWIAGQRNPSAAAQRLIWWVFNATFKPEVLQEPGAWLMWKKATR